MNVILTSPWIPAEWIRAHGLTARGIWHAEHLRCRSPVLSAGVCAFAEEAVHFAETYAEDATVFTTACDQMRRGYDTAQHHGSKRIFLFNLPATTTPVACQLYRAELERLGQFLIALGGRQPTPEKLRHEMWQADNVRCQLREAAPTTSSRGLVAAIGKFQHEGTLLLPLPNPANSLIPLALVGGPMAEADWLIFDALEGAGGRIALNATQSGERSLCPKFSSNLDPFDALASGYFDHITDVFQRPNTRLYAWLKTRLAERGVRGIVLWHFTGCDLWRAEAQTLREIFGLPVLLLEAAEADGLLPRDLTRLQAFVETLK
jgi:benzoyl-CoA reductase/2-hydroxyglutaryl-CoA dehydratase subunit BcrC/BadD/HgdB